MTQNTLFFAYKYVTQSVWLFVYKNVTESVLFFVYKHLTLGASFLFIKMTPTPSANFKNSMKIVQRKMSGFLYCIVEMNSSFSE